MKISQALLKKYNVSGPRYTSYPTALQFDPLFTEKHYRWHIEDSNQHPIPKPISLYLHIPFCHSLCYYCGCHKFITRNAKKVNTYLAALHKEINLQAALFDNDREIKQIHFGGGTPTYLGAEQIAHLLYTIKQNFTLAKKTDLEISIEIDPRGMNASDIQALADIGFNRMSFGVQDFDHQVQIAINRVQDKDLTLELLQAARSANIQSISTDIIYGLPKQTHDSFKATLETIVNARPDRIALYNYAHMPDRIKSQKLIHATDLPSSDEKLALMELSIETLTAADYLHIGMDHFALAKDPLSRSLKQKKLQRNFQGYSTHGDCDTIGLGVSAISQINDGYSQNDKSLDIYNSSIKNNRLAVARGYALTQDDQLRAAVIQQLMCQRTVNFEEFNHLYHIHFITYFQTELNNLSPMIEDKLLTLNKQGLQITNKGCLFLRNIAMVFDAYLSTKDPSDEQSLRFSKVL
ncbi:MAG: oxygen-independent coproporphyrinogen-3 oxidase [Candidatus Endobugula sp.]